MSEVNTRDEISEEDRNIARPEYYDNFKRVVGHWLTGHTREEILAILLGGQGANGKGHC